MIRVGGRLYRIVGIVALLFSASGCAWLSPPGAFEEVKRETVERTGQEIHLRGDADENRKIDAMVRSRLEEPLTAETTMQVALLNNRQLQAAYAELGIARADLTQAGLLPNPVFDGSYQSSISAGEGAELELALVENFIDLLTLPVRRKIAAAQFEAVKLRITGEVLALAADAKSQFYAVQADEQMLEMRRQVVAATHASAEVARRLFDAGNIRALDLENERALDAEARLDLAAAEVDARRNRERLNIVLGLWGRDAQIKITSRLPDVPPEELVEADVERRAIEKNLELAQLRHEITGQGRSLGLANVTSPIPELDVGVAFTREPEGDKRLGPAWSLPIPLFNQGQARRARGRATLRRTQEIFYQRAVEIRAIARATRDGLAIARERALFSRDVALPLRHRIVEQTQLQYNAMQIGVFTLLEAKRAEIEAGNRYIEDLRDYWLARSRMESLLAGHAAGLESRQSPADSSGMSPTHSMEERE